MSEEIPFGIPQLSLSHPAHPQIAQVVWALEESAKKMALSYLIYCWPRRATPSGDPRDSPSGHPPRPAASVRHPRAPRPAPCALRPALGPLRRAPVRPPSGTRLGVCLPCLPIGPLRPATPSGHSVRLLRPATPSDLKHCQSVLTLLCKIKIRKTRK
jgi:hypothetical protein